MTSAFDAPHLSGLLGDAEVARLLSPTAEIRACLIVEGALAKVQGELGIIPAEAAAAIHRASLEAQVDPGALAAATAQNGVVIPALLAAFRKEVGDPAAAAFVHHGATSQDILDTALALRLKRVVGLYDRRLRVALAALAALADTYADLPMAGRTWGQHATPTSFGAVVAAWGRPLLAAITDSNRVEGLACQVSLSGAAGTSNALGAQAVETRAKLAEGLGLSDPEHSWHTERGGIVSLSQWCVGVTGALAKMAADIGLLTMTEVGEVALAASGRSSTMPQKQNPVAAGVLEALATHTRAQASAIEAAQVHRLQRDGAAWITEWLALPQLLLATGRATSLAVEVAEGLQPRPDAMAANLSRTGGAIYAEALTFALATDMPRPEAAALVKDLLSTGLPLPEAARQRFPDRDLGAVFDPAQQLGQAPAEARAFAAAVKALPPAEGG
ncbi:MAG: lyase family protein [Shimia sp.]